MLRGGPILEGQFLLVVGQSTPVQRTQFPGLTRKLDGEEVQIVNPSVGQPPSSSPNQNTAHNFPNQAMNSTPRNFQPVLSIIPSSAPRPSYGHSTARPPLASPMRPSPIAQSKPSTVHHSQQLQPVASTSRTREVRSPLPFPSAQVFQRRECWPIQVTRPDTNDGNEGKEAVARLFRRVYRNSREVIMYANDRMIPGTDSEEMTSRLASYEDELINYFQAGFDDLGREN
ncbi:hypothetical protein O181_024657 [Austropuccinia psidii MF-1]|uniref:Uncharacterized protein n=1 Tax=Austropuccinia psidii MF-1 TaxID=1389203 RepID=A0A9Q3CJQ4_9BASI|nr:hypothetical protein [Austropuccinia psidii MF-1]